MPATFRPGKNIAMKVPPSQFDATVRFYRDTLGFEQIASPSGDVGFKFGAMSLWIDRVPAMSQAELWLEVVASDTAEAAQALEAAGAARCDDIEPLGDAFDGFWVASPCSIIHLVCGAKDSWE